MSAAIKSGYHAQFFKREIAGKIGPDLGWKNRHVEHSSEPSAEGSKG